MFFICTDCHNIIWGKSHCDTSTGLFMPINCPLCGSIKTMPTTVLTKYENLIEAIERGITIEK